MDTGSPNPWKSNPTKRGDRDGSRQALPTGAPSDEAICGDCIVLPGNCGLAMPAFVHHLRVRYNECDVHGHVFNANYLVYFDVTLTELWREALGSYEALQAEGLDLVVAEAGVRFRAPARFDDELEITLQVERLGTTSMVSAI